MSETVNLKSKLKEHLPAELHQLLEAIGAMAAYQGRHIYLVGGAVRDLLLERETLDLDLVVNEDAVDLAQLLANTTGGKLTIHTRFRTANLRWKEWSIDLTTMRSETYDRPGALPKVKPGSLADDLFRRDFTINAMAIHLNPGGYGNLIDLYGGFKDMKMGFIRILHEQSFTDDATRIWRALRYEQRLGFQLEFKTLEWLTRDVSMLDTISGDRIRHEIELALRESLPERVFVRADELKVLSTLQPGLKADHWLAEQFELARKLNPETPPPSLYLALLVYPLNSGQVEQMIKRLNLPKPAAQTLRDTCHLKKMVDSLAAPDVKPSRVYHILHDYSVPAIAATALAVNHPAASRNINLYLDRLRYIKPDLTGEDLKNIGVTPGPRVRKFLERLLAARLDGEASNRQEEEKLVTRWMGNSP